jgi:AraC-like DNA-binding protein
MVKTSHGEGDVLDFFSAHFLISPTDEKLPLYLESVGFIPEQKPFHRERGYPYYHWLQTSDGKGRFIFSGKSYTLSPGRGILLLPGVPHHYEAETDIWRTYYIAFEGSLAQALLGTMDLHFSNCFDLEQPDKLTEFFESTIEDIKSDRVTTGLDRSEVVYRFLLLLKKYGQKQNQTSFSSTYERLSDLLQWLESNYHDPDIGLNQMANLLHVSPQHLNTLFRSIYGRSPYAYLLHFRIQKAKEFMINDRSLTLQSVADRVGFRDTSHFALTFRRITGMTPGTYKRLF